MNLSAGKVQQFFERPTVYRSLYVFPLLASATWLTTISTLLGRWLWLGRPQYPGQVNPWVPFISDIGAFTFQPIFIIGCTLTGLGYFGTVLAVHHVRYSPRFYGPEEEEEEEDYDEDGGHRRTRRAFKWREPWWRKVASLVALVAGLTAASCLVLLAVFDIHDSRVWHRHFLLGTFSGLAASAIALVVVWWDQTSWWGAPPSTLRIWCNVNLFLVICQGGVGIGFLALMYTGHFRTAGILEWTLTYLGAFWMATHIAYVRYTDKSHPEAVNAGNPEEQPLLVG